MPSFYNALTSLPGRYSKALYGCIRGFTQENNADFFDVLDKVIEEADRFLLLLDQQPDFLQVIMAPTLSKTMREKVLVRFFSYGDFSEIFKDFVLLLNQRKRLSILKDCIQILKNIRMREKGILPVTIKSAIPLLKKDEAQVQKVLTGKLRITSPNIKPLFNVQISPALLAGYRIEIPGVVFDASFKKQLEQIQTYIHEGAL